MKFFKFVDCEWDDAYSENFTFLRKIPSSSVLSQLSVILKNKEGINNDFWKKWANRSTDIPQEKYMELALQFLAEEESSLSYLPIKDLKELINNRLPTCDDEKEKELLIKFQSEHKDVTTPNSIEIRKIFLPKIESAFHSKPQNNGGGCWIIPLPVEGKPMELVLDVGGRAKRNDFVDVFPDMKPEKIVFVSYEKIMGFSKPDWNLMRSDMLPHYAEILVEAVKRTIKAISMR
jgi:hypothetical protein